METTYTLSSIRPELDLLTKTIVATVPTEQVYLFGSYAYGTPNENSDLDFYVVLKDDAPMRDPEAMDAIGLALYKKKTHPTDILAFKKRVFMDRKDNAYTIENIVFNRGIKLYG